MSAAVPAYVKGVTDAPPGHRFRLYFQGWNSETWLKAGDLERWKALRACTAVSAEATRALDALCARQKHLLSRAANERLWQAVYYAHAPIVTGLGNEHPLENGFTFLDPHGVPYLPGAGIKGVVRRAAEWLSLACSDSPWTIVDVLLLFGFDEQAAYVRTPASSATETQLREAQQWISAFREHVDRLDDEALLPLRVFFPKDDTATIRCLLTDQRGFAHWRQRLVHVRGALVFHDAYPVLPQQGLEVEVMTPHFSDWYRAEHGWPTDDEDPKPLGFLAMPVDTRFSFYVECDVEERVPVSWRDRLKEAFDYAATQLGFGAKTSAGYGRLGKAPAPKDPCRVRQEKERQQRLAALQEQQTAQAAVVNDPYARERQRLTPWNRNAFLEVYQRRFRASTGEEKRRWAELLKEAAQEKGLWEGARDRSVRRVIGDVKRFLGEA